MKVYFLSGLGADKRVFQFLDLSFCEPVFVDWITPLPNESLPNYALRLRATINETHPVIVGVSFGGMLATEIAKTDPSIRAVIISSNKTANEFPNYLRAWKNFQFYRALPHALVMAVTKRSNWLFTAKGEKQVAVFQQILNETDLDFNYWAIDAILKWTNAEVPKNLVHIHGTHDRLLKYKLVKCDYTIKGGTHLMVMNNHEEISELLRSILLRKEAQYLNPEYH